MYVVYFVDLYRYEMNCIPGMLHRTVVKKMEVATFHQKSEAGSPRGGEAVHYGCSMSTMSYFTFAMIGIYTAINVNNVS